MDLGSGLGVDSFIACHYVGKKGKVTALDISKMEIAHSKARAQKRGLMDQMSFAVSDMENM